MSNVDFSKTRVTNGLTSVSERRSSGNSLAKPVLLLMAIAVGWYVIN